MQTKTSSMFLWIMIGFLVAETRGQNDICSESTLTDGSGNVSSPNYPNAYGNSLNCMIKIVTSADKVLLITFLDLDIETDTFCSNDELKIYDGTTLYTSKGFCGSTLPRNFEAHNPNVTLIFTTDADVAGRGFLIQWTTSARCADSEFSCWNGECIPSTQLCDGTKHCPDDSDEIECEQASDDFSECGKVSVAPHFLWNTRIVGGNEAIPGSWPWQVRLTIIIGGSSFLCGGSIINAYWVVTAAHCTINTNASQITVLAGYHSTSQTSGVQSSGVSLITNHPSYNSTSQQNDLSLLFLSTKLIFGNTVKAICIPEDTATFDLPTGTICVATGFGTLAFGYYTSNSLQQVRLPLVEQSQCAATYNTLQDTNVCAGHYSKGGVDSCQGDSGGPLACFVNEEKWYLIGITSYGDECAKAMAPGVYTRVSKYQTWISANSPVPTVPTTTTTDAECTSCVLTAPWGNITSPEYPSNYARNLDRNWTIETTADKVIHLVFVDFELERSDNCEHDYLRIYDGNELYAGRPFCGSTLPLDFAALTTTVLIEFHTDLGITGRGFLIRWNTTDRCGTDEYTCWNGSCIPIAQHCDGVRHCGDDSDEIECSQIPVSLNECGKIETPPVFTWDHRIVGGNTAVQNSWPWQASVFQYGVNQPLCGGSIISDEWILTSAHCVQAYNIPSTLHVDVGKHTRIGGENQTRDVLEIHVHPSYITFSEGNDIALLKLILPLTFNAQVRPVCLPSDDVTTEPGILAIASGFGDLYYTGPNPDVLYQVRIPIVSNSQCETLFNGTSTIHASQLCAGNIGRGGIGTCQGDSGGPLVVLESETSWTLIGVTSYGVGCGNPGFPGVYTRVASFRNWIDETQSGATETTTSTTTTIGTTGQACRPKLSILQIALIAPILLRAFLLS